MRTIAVSVGVVVALLLAVLGGLIAFGVAKRPAPMLSVTAPFTRIDYRDLPPLRRYTARDGKGLAFRKYQPDPRAKCEPTQVAVLIHGSAGSSIDMHPLAQTLARAGVLVYVPDVRGHGANRPHGNIRYVGQLDDDLTDFVRIEKPKNPNATWILTGFSSGGGFALRFDAEPSGYLFDRYLLLSPYLTYKGPTARQPADGKKDKKDKGQSDAGERWSVPYTGRIFALVFADQLDIHWFDDLDVLAFAVPPDVESVTSRYSMRMMINFGAGRPWSTDYLSYIRNIRRPTAVIVGASDELLNAGQLATVFQSEKRDVPVMVLPGIDHVGMILSPPALSCIREWFHKTTPR